MHGCRLIILALLVVCPATGAAYAQSFGPWHVPSTSAQFCGHGFGAGHHAPIVHTPCCRPPHVQRMAMVPANQRTNCGPCGLAIHPLQVTGCVSSCRSCRDSGTTRHTPTPAHTMDQLDLPALFSAPKHAAATSSAESVATPHLETVPYPLPSPDMPETER